MNATTLAERSAHLEWVPLSKMRINPAAQREFNPGWASDILTNFDIDKLQFPTVSLRDGEYFVCDGQHSVWAYKMWLGDWEGQKLQCMVHHGLTEPQEADLFLSLNNKRAVNAIAKFKAAVTAGWADECDIDRVVRANGAVVSTNRSLPGAISAVASLRAVYRNGPATLGSTIRVIRDSYGDAGYEAAIIRGVGAVINRYPAIDLDRLVTNLGKASGGSKGLLNMARAVRENVGGGLNDGVSVAVVRIYNRGRGGKKLPTWEIEA